MYSSLSCFLLSLSILCFFHVSYSLPSVHSDNFNTKFDIIWGNGHGRISNDGQLLSLSLDKESGSGFRSKDQYLFGKLDMQIRLVPGNSAGTVTTFYLSSQGSNHDEIDFEFLGNVSGDPYILHTNVFTRGKGNREQQFYLWFDPAKDFHTYSILWTPQHVIFYVDGIPIRDFKNLHRYNVDFPRNQPMRLYSSIWDGEDWATRGGLVKTDWSKAPFVALYKNFESRACVWTYGKSRCASVESWFNQQLDVEGEKKLKWVQENYMIYNYCTDRKRGIPAECIHM